MNLDFRYINDIGVIQQMVRERVAQSQPGEVIRGRGWDHELFPEKRWPTKEVLDKVAPDNPVILSRSDGHSIWVNSLVLKESDITNNTPDPPGGTIVRDAETGEAGRARHRDVGVSHLFDESQIANGQDR